MHFRIMERPKGMNDAQYHASAQNWITIAMIVISAFSSTSAAMMVTAMLSTYAALAPMRTGEAIN